MGGVGAIVHLVAAALDFCDKPLDTVVRARSVDQRPKSLTRLLGGLGGNAFSDFFVRLSARLTVASLDLCEGTDLVHAHRLGYVLIHVSMSRVRFVRF